MTTRLTPSGIAEIKCQTGQLVVLIILITWSIIKTFFS